MKNSYITLTEALLSLRSCSGRLLQIEGRLGMASNPAVAQAAMPEVRDVRFAVNAAMDMLVEVQAELPEPTKGQIIKHYYPDAVDVADIGSIMGIPEGKPIKAHLGKAEPAFKPLVLDPEAFLGISPGLGKSEHFKTMMPYPEDGGVVMSKATFNRLEDERINAILSMEEGDIGVVSDGRPAGWTEALALEFIGTQYVDCVDQFAKAFNEGDWPTIQKEWPEFQTWINKQLEGSDALKAYLKEVDDGNL